jgi:putative tryptophan/tyrosine transport system substrate-binding protein
MRESCTYGSERGARGNSRPYHDRREFITLIGGTAAWPLAARAQQPAMPVIGFLHPTSLDQTLDRLRGFRQGLKDTGYVEGENVTVEYRWAEGQYDRLSALVADLARRKVSVIATGGLSSSLAAKATTTTIPIVFNVGEDPVRTGLVASLSRPGGNATGVNFFVTELGSKQLGLLHELIPAAARVGLLVNPNYPSTKRAMRDVTAAASAIGLQVDVVQASDSREIESVFGTLVRNRADALLVGPDAFFVSRRLQLAILAARHAIPAVYNVREYAEAGGLMSYGTNVRDAWRQIGVYSGRILKGAKPVDLPVVQSSKFELVINLPTARALGIEVPPTLLARADEVIE